ncbi:MAG: hypothetical protein L0Y56_15360, partial [Nitrospira sp.]|nr:hypothetical protein [Nitrospira sp.]
MVESSLKTMHPYSKAIFIAFFTAVLTTSILFSALETSAQEASAFIESPQGIVVVSFQGQGEVRAKSGMALQPGDIVRTEVGARVT